MGIIKAENLSYDYIRRDENGKAIATINALKNLNFEIDDGEFVAIVGRNGSGKSTLAKLINGLIIPTNGRLLAYGMDVSDEKNIWEIRKRAGMVFQNPDNQIIASVVEEDVAFGPENIGVPSDEIIKRVDLALRTVGMQDYRDASPNRLSGGQKQRIAIAGALAMKPQCIIFDESTAMLDPIGRAEVMNVIKKLNLEEKMTIILITHYMEEAAMADRVIVLDSGEIKLSGTPKQVFSNKEELYGYGLELPMVSLLADELREAGLDITPGVTTADELVEEICR